MLIFMGNDRWQHIPIIIEAMKMEIPVVAPEAGTIASIDVAVGDAVESGAVLATLN